MFRFLVLVLALSAVALAEEDVSVNVEVELPVEVSPVVDEEVSASVELTEDDQYPVDETVYTQEEVDAAANQFDRIVGGSAIGINSVPWQLSLRLWNSHLCGASLISPLWAVSAAHCTINRNANVLSLMGGSNNRNSGGQVRNVNLLINHPQYNAWTIDNDICLLRVASAFSLSNSIRAIGLPNQGAGVNTGAYGIVSGWGALSEGGSSPAVLQHVWLPVVAQGTCNALYSGRITNNMLCAGYIHGGRDACQGDSGGPYAIGNSLVGVVSWGNGCARPNFPGVYARTSMYRNWIRQHTGI